MSEEKTYQIEELPDLKEGWDRACEYQDVPLLDYVWEVANHFLPDCVETDKGMMPAESKAPAIIFGNRYFERNLTVEEQYERAKDTRGGKTKETIIYEELDRLWKNHMEENYQQNINF